eukprot:TRINITY_DN61013_c0_g1_i1.p1 TRINITY_DN61013_c0_g1~~TRINITY_DN61013_c0_g1_i1.p1  ORF type:complete len:290 (+),score=28.77 TRINITY_DN61013_c0_g1_i1:36-905(+)
MSLAFLRYRYTAVRLGFATAVSMVVGFMSLIATSSIGGPVATSVSMPWTRTWEVPFFVILALGILFVALAAVVWTSDGAAKRFAHFWRGDISAFLAERWHISVPLFPVFAVLLFVGIRARHPMSSPHQSLVSSQFLGKEDPDLWNAVARCVAGISCAGIIGLSTFTQIDYTNKSRYLLQTNTGHGICMFLGFGMLFVYMFMHVGFLVYDLSVGALTGTLTCAIAAFQAGFAALAGINFCVWQAEVMKEEFPDDPKCDKQNEWWCVLCVALFLLTLPLLTEFCPCGRIVS